MQMTGWSSAWARGLHGWHMNEGRLGAGGWLGCSAAHDAYDWLSFVCGGGTRAGMGTDAHSLGWQ